MTNFDFLLTTPKFSTFAPVAVSAEKILRWPSPIRIPSPA